MTQSDPPNSNNHAEPDPGQEQASEPAAAGVRMLAASVSPEPLGQALGRRYLAYALSTITQRALPDVRDGLKPVHRRILWAMRELRLNANGPFRKSAKIAGDVMGNYHPHGDAAIYDAMVRLAQPFAMRYPLVDGQGNFGSIDGDNPAAARYTEARLTLAAEALLVGIDEEAVAFRANYDGSLREPVVLPAAFPNLLANGASGIAVGMATNIPPHNLDELCAAARALIAEPDLPHVALMALVPGPDFPTGGVIVEPPESLAEIYRTGRGSIRLRASWQVEHLPRGAWQIVITEIPYQVPKAKLIERLAQLIEQKKVPALADVRDESAADIRIVLEPKNRTLSPESLMAALFRLSELEIRFPVNMNVLIDGRIPRVVGLREALQAFLDHRRDVLIRRSKFRLANIERRLEVLEGLLIAFVNLDRLIDIIRYDPEPKAALMRESWHGPYRRAESEETYEPPPIESVGPLSEAQAEAILNMRLRALRRLEEMALRAERDALLAAREELTALLAEPARQWAKIDAELAEIVSHFGQETPLGQRRTRFAALDQEPALAPEAMLAREPLTIVCSKLGWIRTIKGHVPLDQEFKVKEGDTVALMLHAETTDKVLLFASTGRCYTLAAHALPGGRGMGEPVRLLIDLPNEARIVAMRVFRKNERLLVASRAGDGFIVSAEDVLGQTRAGKQVLNLGEGGEAHVFRPVTGDHVAVIGENRKLLIFPLVEVPEMARGKGVRLMRFRNGGLSDLTTFTLAEGLAWTDSAGRIRRVFDLTEWLGRRGGLGRMAPRGFPRDNRFC